MKEQIKQLIANGNSEKALELLVQANSDALLLLAQFNSGKKNFNMGLIEHAEWQRIQARVNYAALELAGKLPDDTPSVPMSKSSTGAPIVQGTGDGNVPVSKPGDNSTGDGRLPPKVFISYSQMNNEVALRIKTNLETAGAQVFIDQETFPPGIDIEHFIEEGIRDNHYMVAIISRESLQSGWVSKEISMGFIAQRITNRRLLPVKIDNSYDDDDFYFESLDLFEQEIEKSNNNIKRAIDRDADIRPFQGKLARYQDLKNNFGPIVQKLKSIYLVDIGGDNFEQGMKKINRTIWPNGAAG